MDHLNKYQVDRHPVHYIPNFINETEEITLLRKIESSPAGKWRNLPNHFKCGVEKYPSPGRWFRKTYHRSLPTFVCALTTLESTSPNLLEKLRSTGAFSATSQGTVNHIILNEYLPGQGITPHQDGPAYHPVVATLTLGSHAVMEYYRYRDTSPKVPSDSTTKMDEEIPGKVIDPVPVLRLLLESRSLVITHGALYTQHLHGISGAHHDIFAPDEDLDALQAKYMGKEGSTQVVSAWDIANRGILGSQDLRDRFAQLTSSTKIAEQGAEEDRIICLERRTRASLTCRVVEKTSKAAGRLLKLR